MSIVRIGGPSGLRDFRGTFSFARQADVYAWLGLVGKMNDEGGADSWHFDQQMLERMRRVKYGVEVLATEGGDLADEEDLRAFLTTEPGGSSSQYASNPWITLTRSKDGESAEVHREKEHGFVTLKRLKATWWALPSAAPTTPEEVYREVSEFSMPERMEQFLARGYRSKEEHPENWEGFTDVLEPFWKLERASEKQ